MLVILSGTQCIDVPIADVSNHWGRVTHICSNKLTMIGSDNGLSPGWYRAIIWTSARILLIEPLGAKFNEILLEIYTFSFMKMHLKMSSVKCVGLDVLMVKHYFSVLFLFPTKTITMAS